MIERLEVTPGEGTVIRFGYVSAWAAATASPALLSFLAESARNLASSPVGGAQLADHLAGVLDRRDPEPDVAFAVVGPSGDGWAAILHGPVQLWDGLRWVVSDPATGWRRCPLWPQPSLAVGPAGAAVAAPAPDSLHDLESGIVPGGGFLLIPAVAVRPGGTTPDATAAPDATAVTPAFTGGEPEAPREPEPQPEPAPEPGSAVPMATVAAAVADPVTDGPAAAENVGSPPGPEPEPAPEPEPVAGPDAAPDAEFEPHAGAGPGAEPEPQPAAMSGAAAAAPPEPAQPESGPGRRAPAGVLDLTAPSTGSRLVPYPPLPPGGSPTPPVPGAPVVAGAVCPRGHLNRPGMGECARCGRPISPGTPYNVTGTRPALGCLVIDDGRVVRLDTGYLVGSDPTRDPTVRGRLARPLVLAGEDVSPSHAEIRLQDWDVAVTDRASTGGTCVYEPDSTAWERLRPYETRVLRPGTHIAFGQRVVTFVTPWVTGPAA